MVVLNSAGDFTLEYISPMSNTEVSEPSSLLQSGRSVNSDSEVGLYSDVTSNPALSSISAVRVRKVSSFSKRLGWGEVGAKTVHGEVSKLSFAPGDPEDKVLPLSNSQCSEKDDVETVTTAQSS